MRKLFLYLTAFALIIFFLWTRFYKIETSLLFFNDIGRDFLVMWQWQQTGKPPLLGPQTSALPFNQSAIYFYLLYPFYLLSGHSPYATLIACSFFYVLSFIVGLYCLRNRPRLEKSLLAVFFLIIIHPQYIIQGRFIWNPSFVTPCLLVAIYSLLIYLQEAKPDSRKLLLSTMALALAISFSYSVAPLLLAVLGLLVYRSRQSVAKFLAYLVTSLAIWNLPTAVFELRHDFLLSKMMLFGEKLPQPDNILLTKASKLLEFCLSPNYLVVATVLVVILLFTFFSLRKKSDYLLINICYLLVIALVSTIASPIAIHAHYVFGVMSLLFLLISFFDSKQLFFLLSLLVVIFSKRSLEINYFAPARHSVADLQACAVHFCASYRQPLFISGQSSHHPYHNATEFQYLMREAGCQVRDINTQAEQAQTMAVVLDNDTYEHGKTSFNELSLFGKANEKERFVCEKSLEIVVLEK